MEHLEQELCWGRGQDPVYRRLHLHNYKDTKAETREHVRQNGESWRVPGGHVITRRLQTGGSLTYKNKLWTLTRLQLHLH